MNRLIITISATLLLGACTTTPDAVSPDGSLDLRGRLVHLDRMALPETANALLELRAFTPYGIEVLAHSRLSLGGRQVPIDFQLSAPARSSGAAEVVELRAAVELDGELIRVSESLPVFATGGEQDIGEILIRPPEAMDVGTVFDCGGTGVMFVDIGAQGTMRVGTEQFAMRQTRSASGVRYEALGDAATVLHTKGTRAVVSVGGEYLPECTMPPEPTQPLRATGNEPPWIATVGDDRITLTTEYGAMTHTLALLHSQQSGPVTRYRAADGQLALAMTVWRRVCHDSMTGMPYPYSVALLSGQGELRGCGGDPLD